MTDPQPLSRWIEAYRQAWNSNDPADIAGLFTEDAAYYTEPFTPPWRGRDKIVANWLERKDEPDETTFEWSPLVVTEDVAIITATTTYPDTRYSNLWVIRLDADGRAREFTEWWMDHSHSSS